ncbi:uncharacterized protein LOC120299160 isoform X1 [Crotalus tigris]|uniref:uncharacterized protein LOC120299160 isoform X1 n=1 Tax=Crotalus tigris TaxID=88082 RepID=UPI00192F1BD2|nr:uncharacterized protein LOC120299160 isoform X1 [Crotalus tigris]
MTDNVAAKAHVNRQGGTRSWSLMQEALDLGLWAESILESIYVENISEEANQQANSLSRATVDHSEWRLDLVLFLEISRQFGQLQVDLFALEANSHLPRYFTRFWSPGAEGTDALHSRWPKELLYAFPPLPLIQATIRKLLLEQAEVILVVPHWPRWRWFADLMDLSLSPPWRIPPSRIALSRESPTSRSPVASTSHLAREWESLVRQSYSSEIISMIQASRRRSTNRIYDATWRNFCQWYITKNLRPLRVSIPDILEYLLEGLNKGLSHSTIRRQIAALSTVLMCDNLHSLSQHPAVAAFLKGAINTRPPTVHRYPSWDLPKVLQALSMSPFEPLGSCSLYFLSLKVAFLVAITSARRISELAGLSIRSDLCMFLDDRVVFRLDPFVPKVNT